MQKLTLKKNDIVIFPCPNGLPDGHAEVLKDELKKIILNNPVIVMPERLLDKIIVIENTSE